MSERVWMASRPGGRPVRASLGNREASGSVNTRSAMPYTSREVRYPPNSGLSQRDIRHPNTRAQGSWNKRPGIRLPRRPTPTIQRTTSHHAIPSNRDALKRIQINSSRFLNMMVSFPFLFRWLFCSSRRGRASDPVCRRVDAIAKCRSTISFPPSAQNDRKSQRK